MVRLTLPITRFSEVDKVVRLRCQILSRIKGLKRQYDLLDTKPGADIALEVECGRLQSYINRLVDFNIVQHTYESVRQDWIKEPINLKQHSINIFGDFKKSRYDIRNKLNNLKASYAILSKNGDISESSLARFEADIQREEDNVLLMEKYLETMEQGQIAGRKQEVVRRLLLEADQRIGLDGWYCVFNTLTVAPTFLDKVFPKKSETCDSKRKYLSYWQEYIRHLDRDIARACYGSVRKAKGQNYHSYLAVYENGSRTGRPHIHVLHFMKSIPSSWSDPNKGSIQPYKREILQMKNYWLMGDAFSTPIAVRFSHNDAFARKGWVWPVKQIVDDKGMRYEAVQANPPCAVVMYVAKYLTKTYNQKYMEHIWRIRQSRNLGVQSIQEYLMKLNERQVIKILLSNRFLLQLRNLKLPKRLTRKLFMKSLSVCVKVKLLMRAWLNPPFNILTHLRSLIQRVHGFNLVKSGSIRITNTFRTNVSNLFSSSPYKLVFGGAHYAAV